MAVTNLLNQQRPINITRLTECICNSKSHTGKGLDRAKVFESV